MSETDASAIVPHGDRRASARHSQHRRRVLAVAALLSLALGVATATSAAAISADGATPWAYIVAGFGCLCLASVIVRFTSRMASAGASTRTSRAD